MAYYCTEHAVLNRVPLAAKHDRLLYGACGAVLNQAPFAAKYDGFLLYDTCRAVLNRVPWGTNCDGRSRAIQHLIERRRQQHATSGRTAQGVLDSVEYR